MTGYDLNRNLLATNQGFPPQEGGAYGISNQRHGPKASHPEH